MHFTNYTSVINLIVLGIHVFVQLAAAILIYIKKHNPQDRSWRFILLFFLVSAIASTVEIVLVTNQSFAPNSYKLLDPLINIPGFYIFAILLCYIIELLRPRWLNFKRIFGLFLPSLISAAFVLIFVARGEVTSLCNLSELCSHISQPNIIARVVFITIYIPYFIYLIILRMQTKTASASKYHNILVLLTTMLCISYVFSRGLQLYLGYITHEVLYLLLSILIVYFEYYERIHVPLEKVRDYYTWEQLPHTTQDTLKSVAQTLQQLMDNPSIWQDPELTGDKVVHLVGTNRTYIQQAAKQLGFASLSDMINRRRIDYVCQQLRKDPNVPVQTLFTNAGYRSRTTAWRHFTAIVGCTPSEFVERHTSTKND